MNHTKLIDELLKELSYRVGIVDIHNKEQQSIMSEILTEWGEFEAKETIFRFLNEVDDTEGEDADYAHIGKGFYVKSSDKGKEGAQKYKKDDNGNLKPVSADEYEKEKDEQGEEGEQAASTSPQNQQGGDGESQQEPPQGQALNKNTKSGKSYYDNVVSKEDETRKKLEKEKNSSNSKQKSDKQIEKQDEILLNRVQQQIEKNSVALTEEQKKIAQECYSETEKLFDNSISENDKISIASQIRDKYKITTNAGNTKYYINVLGKNRKLFGDGTKSSEKLVEQLKKYTQLDQVDFSGIKKNLTAAAKPDLGKDFEVKPNQSEQVKFLFQSSPILSRIKESQHGIYAPKDESGNILFPSNQHTKEYLKQSFENPALSKTIELAREYVNQGNLSKDYLASLENHQKRLKGIIDNYDIPSNDIAKAIDDSYNDLMVDLNNADPEAASAVMKQLAENRLYETELAKGNEVYLPSNGSFPGGDIIKVKNDLLERVSLVSCKFGKEGRTYGCPANMKAVTQLHPDESKREMFGQYVGEPGFTMMIKDELIKGDSEEETQKKTKSLLKESLLNQSLTDSFDDDELDKVSKICSDYFYKLNNTRIKLESELGNVKADVFWGEYQKELSKFKKEYQIKIQDIVTPDKLEKIVGVNNVPNFKTRLTPDVFISGVLLTENIRTSGGYGLDHNKQYYDENSEPVFKTDKGTDNPDDYSLTIRNERTAGRNGGGIQMSYTGDGKRPAGEILPM